MTTTNIPPCPVHDATPARVRFGDYSDFDVQIKCQCALHMYETIPLSAWVRRCNEHLVRALRASGIETVEQVRELVGIACDACDERTVRATNRAENLVPLLRRRAGER